MIDPIPKSPGLTRQQWRFRARLINAQLDRLTLDELMREGRIGEAPHLGAASPQARGYDPNQPRIPAGDTDGGQWTSIGGSRARTDEPDSEQANQRAFLLANRHHHVRTNTEGARRLEPLNTFINFDEPEKDSHKANHRAEGGSIPTGQQVPRYAELRQPSAADEIAIERTTQLLSDTLFEVNQKVSRRRDLALARLYGIAVHKAFADAVRAQNLPGIGVEGVEQSFDLRGFARYGLDGSIRTDVVLRNEKGLIIAIYDVKTGNATMRSSREAKIRAYTKAGREVPLIILHAKRGPW